MLSKIIAAIGVILVVGVTLATSWALTCGMIYLITVCFSLIFSWKIATGIWLILCLLSSFFRSSNKSKK